MHRSIMETLNGLGCNNLRCFSPSIKHRVSPQPHPQYNGESEGNLQERPIEGLAMLPVEVLAEEKKWN